MNTPSTLAARIAAIIIPRVAGTRPPDFIIGADNLAGPYLLRWYLTPWTRARDRARKRAESAPTFRHRVAARALGLLPNLYLHCFQRDDDDRALHDHPSWAVSYILRGGYIEHTIAAGGVHHRRTYLPGSLRYMGTRHAHRIELFDLVVFRPRRGGLRWMAENGAHGEKSICWTLFLLGPTVREWGFHCPKGWVHFRRFTAPGNRGEVGRGCD